MHHYNKRKRPTIDPVEQELLNYIKKPNKNEDIHHHFAMTIANEMRKLPERKASMLRIKIQTELHNAVYVDEAEESIE